METGKSGGEARAGEDDGASVLAIVGVLAIAPASGLNG